MPDLVKCPRCDGTGAVGGAECSLCGGVGAVAWDGTTVRRVAVGGPMELVPFRQEGTVRVLPPESFAGPWWGIYQPPGKDPSIRVYWGGVTGDHYEMAPGMSDDEE